jgi:hypothetical protein
MNPSTGKTRKTVGLLSLVAAGTALVGAFIPWAYVATRWDGAGAVTLPPVGWNVFQLGAGMHASSITWEGITIMVGMANLALGGLAALRPPRPSWLLGVGSAAVLIGAVAAPTLSSLNIDTFHFSAWPGPGRAVTIAAAALGFVATVIAIGSDLERRANSENMLERQPTPV